MRVGRHRPTVVGGLFLLLAMGGAANEAVAQATQAVRVVPETEVLELEVGSTARLTATIAGVDAPNLRWFSPSSEVVEVSPDGQVRALAPGEASVSVVALGVEGAVPGTVRIRVPTLPPATLQADAPTTALWVGTGAPLRVTGLDRDGRPTPPGRMAYAVSDRAVLDVDGSGYVYALGAGRAEVRVRAGEATTAVAFEVTAPGSFELALRASPTASGLRTGDVVRFHVQAAAGSTDRTVYPAWSLSGAGAQIEADGAEGVFVAEEPGTYVVTARVGRDRVVTETLEVEERTSEETLVQVGRGGISTHHSGDMWVFEGIDGRDYVYVGTFMHDWMKVWDVTDAAAPVLTDSLQFDARRINDVKIHPNNRLGIVTREGASNRRNGIVLLDLSAPAHPRVISHYEESVTGGVHNVWIDGERDLLYAVHNGTSNIHILDISDPAAVREVGVWGLEKQNKTLHDVIVQEGYAFLSYWDDGVVVLDVGAGTHGGTPTTPTFVSQYKYPIGNTHVAWLAGDYLFLGDEIFPDDWNADRPIEARGYIHVVDVSDIENPHEVAFYRVPEAGAHNVWVEGDRLYIGYYQAGLRVVDISGELRGDLYAQGREVAALRTTDSETTVPNWPMAWGAQIFKGRIYSSDLNSGIWITRLQPKSRIVS